MQNVLLIVEFLLTIILSGLVATAAMTLLMNAITRSGFANADMVRAIGSAITGKYEESLLVGTVAHFITGTLLATVYVLLFMTFNLTSMSAIIFTGLGLGFIHGFVVSFILVVLVAEWHPLPQFKKPGFEVVAAYLVGHVLYGTIIGGVVAATGVMPLLAVVSA